MTLTNSKMVCYWYYAIMYLNMRRANVGVRMIALANRLIYHHAIAQYRLCMGGS